jgi:hypothetical protein
MGLIGVVTQKCDALLRIEKRSYQIQNRSASWAKKLASIRNRGEMLSFGEDRRSQTAATGPPFRILGAGLITAVRRSGLMPFEQALGQTLQRATE